MRLPVPAMHRLRPRLQNPLNLARNGVAVRTFNSSPRLLAVKPFVLTDIGEGIREVQIIQWFVQPGARVEQFDKLCEVQSDKATVEITSRFDGVIKKLHYEADDMATVGQPLVDIDILSEVSLEDEALLTPNEQATEEDTEPLKTAPDVEETGKVRVADRPGADSSAQHLANMAPARVRKRHSSLPGQPHEQHASPHTPARRLSQNATLATPAVRHLTKELNVEITDISGTGKDGRVLKEDVLKYASERSSGPIAQRPTVASVASGPVAFGQDESPTRLTPIQAQMFKAMTASLTIPHFLYSDTFDMTAISALRHGLITRSNIKISALTFILKSISLALLDFPILNARLDFDSDGKPQLYMRSAHNFGIAVDTPQGLMVPVIKDIRNRSVSDIAVEMRRVSGLARENKLGPAELSGGTMTVSNVGSIGGTVVAPVLVEGQLAIVGVGKAKAVPAFGANGEIVRREECIMSWSADHRVVDGATVARCAERVRSFLEHPGEMLLSMK